MKRIKIPLNVNRWLTARPRQAEPGCVVTSPRPRAFGFGVKLIFWITLAGMLGTFAVLYPLETTLAVLAAILVESGRRLIRAPRSTGRAA